MESGKQGNGERFLCHLLIWEYKQELNTEVMSLKKSLSCCVIYSMLLQHEILSWSRV